MDNTFNNRELPWSGESMSGDTPLLSVSRETGVEIKRVLLIGGSESDHRLIELLLTSRKNRLWYEVQFQLDHQPLLSEGLRALQQVHYDAVLLDLCTAVSPPLECISRINTACDNAPVVVLTCNQSLVTAIEALRCGAEDSLEIQELTSHHLTSSLLHAMERSRRQHAEKRLRQLHADQQAAGMVQASLLPRCAPRIRGLSIAGSCRQADHVGGDYYDFFQLKDDQFGFVLADVSSHGLTPALIMAGLRRLLRSLAQTTCDIGAIVSLANRAILEDTLGNQFVTLFFASLDMPARTMRYVAAGHPGYLVSPDGSVTGLHDTFLPLGVAPTIYTTSDPIPLSEFELLFAITDGFTEAMNPGEQVFGTQRATGLVADHRWQSPARIIQTLSRRVADFRGNAPPADDCAAVVVKFADEEPAEFSRAADETGL